MKKIASILISVFLAGWLMNCGTSSDNKGGFDGNQGLLGGGAQNLPEDTPSGPTEDLGTQHFDAIGEPVDIPITVAKLETPRFLMLKVQALEMDATMRFQCEPDTVDDPQTTTHIRIHNTVTGHTYDQAFQADGSCPSVSVAMQTMEDRLEITGTNLSQVSPPLYLRLKNQKLIWELPNGYFETLLSQVDRESLAALFAPAGSSDTGAGGENDGELRVPAGTFEFLSGIASRNEDSAGSDGQVNTASSGTSEPSLANVLVNNSNILNALRETAEKTNSTQEPHQATTANNTDAAHDDQPACKPKVPSAYLVLHYQKEEKGTSPSAKEGKNGKGISLKIGKNIPTKNKAGPLKQVNVSALGNYLKNQPSAPCEEKATSRSVEERPVPEATPPPADEPAADDSENRSFRNFPTGNDFPAPSANNQPQATEADGEEEDEEETEGNSPRMMAVCDQEQTNCDMIMGLF